MPYKMNRRAAIIRNRTEPEKRDLVTEARELLVACGEWESPADTNDVERALFADAIERQRQSPFWGYSKPVGRLYFRAPELLRLLADELEEWRTGKR